MLPGWQANLIQKSRPPTVLQLHTSRGGVALTRKINITGNNYYIQGAGGLVTDSITWWMTAWT